MPVIFILLSFVASASFCCLLDTHQICNDFQNQSLAFLRFHSNKLHQWVKEEAKLHRNVFGNDRYPCEMVPIFFADFHLLQMGKVCSDVVSNSIC